MTFEFKSKELASRILTSIKDMNLDIKVMHVCGGHQETLVLSGLDDELKDRGIDVRQGPGCPVCVTPAREIELVMELAKRGVTIAVFGDMVRVPGKNDNLMDMRAEGADVQMVYSIDDAVKYAEKNPEKQVVFMGIGFETTAPSTAAVLSRGMPRNMSILSTHRYVPPALEAIVNMGEIKLSGLIEPGHVCAITGTFPYDFLTKDYGVPQVVAGFEPMDLLVAIYQLAEMVSSGRAELKNEYTRVVKPEGNRRAQALLEEVFEPADTEWRGFGVIPKSSMKIRDKFADHDASLIYEDVMREVEKMDLSDHPGCQCSEVLRGLVDPEECALFGEACTPLHPVGPCMVTAEGGCHIALKYSKKKRV